MYFWAWKANYKITAQLVRERIMASELIIIVCVHLVVGADLGITCIHSCNYSVTSIIRPPMGQAYLAAIMRWLEHNVNSIKQFAPLWHKMALLPVIVLVTVWYWSIESWHGRLLVVQALHERPAEHSGVQKNSAELSWITNSSIRKQVAPGKQHISSNLEHCLRKTPVPLATRSPSANNNCSKSVNIFCNVTWPVSVIKHNHLNWHMNI